jgi:hypothetical protein
MIDRGTEIGHGGVLPGDVGFLSRTSNREEINGEQNKV